MQVCLAANKFKRRWYLDSGCSRHMTGDTDQFYALERKEGGVVTFGNNGKGKIIGTSKIQITPSTFIDQVLLVDKLKHNLLSIVNYVIKVLKLYLNHPYTLFQLHLMIPSSLLDTELAISI